MGLTSSRFRVSGSHRVSKEIEVDCTDEVECLAEELAEKRVQAAVGQAMGVPGILDPDLAVLAVRRAVKREGASSRVVLAVLLRQLRADALSREVAALLGWKRGGG